MRAWVFGPLYFYACSLLFRIDFKRLSDAMTPCFMLGFGFAHLGCMFAGCCHGYPYGGFGAIYNPVMKCYAFPVQLLESIGGFVLFAIFVIHAVKTGFRITGRQYPVMLMCYTGRFFFEFLRDNEKLFGGVSSLSLHALFGGLVGVIWFYCTSESGKRRLAKITNSRAGRSEGDSERSGAKLVAAAAVSLLVFAGCVVYLLLKVNTGMAAILVCLFALFAAVFFAHCLMQLKGRHGKTGGAA